MEYQDLRDWIQIADEMGELKTLKGCDWNLEIGAITEIVAHKEDGPAVLFEDIKGYPKGYRVLSNSLSSRKRLALTLGLPAGETKMDFVKIWKDNYKSIKPVPAKFVKKSGLFDNVYKDGDIDMQNLLIPQTVRLSAGEMMLLEQKLDVLRRFGFDLEPFGPDAYAIHSVPALLPEGDYSQVVRQMVADLAEVDTSSKLREHLEDRLATIACHSVIRANRMRLTGP